MNSAILDIIRAALIAPETVDSWPADAAERAGDSWRIYVESIRRLRTDGAVTRERLAIALEDAKLFSEAQALGELDFDLQGEAPTVASVQRAWRSMPRPGKKEATPPKPDRKQAELLVEIAMEAGVNLFHDAAGEGFATAAEGATLAVRSRAFGLWVRETAYRRCGCVPSESAMTEALAHFESRGRFDGPELPVYVRAARGPGGIYVDLGDATYRVVEVDRAGWRLVSGRDAPVRFRRPGAMEALPEPMTGGRLSDLRAHLNLPDDGAWALVAGCLVASIALAPRGPFPLLVLRGEQGSAKSTATRRLASLVDPRRAGLRALPSDMQDLAVGAHNSHLLAFDNVSEIEPWLSDALCRISTGSGFATRELYTNREEAIIDATRPVILNGIGNAALRGDLVDRCVVVELPVIPENARKTERAGDQAFEAARPAILGALLDAISLALRTAGQVRLAELPRMADFAVVAVAAESAMGVERGTFLAAYVASRTEAAEATVGGDVFASTIRAFLTAWPGQRWQGSASDLLRDLRRPEPIPVSRWPSTATAMGARLTRIAPALRQIGIEALQDRSGARRTWTLALTPASPPVTPSPDEASQEKTSKINGDDTMTPMTPRAPTSPPLASPEDLWGAAEVARLQALLSS